MFRRTCRSIVPLSSGKPSLAGRAHGCISNVNRTLVPPFVGSKE
jgi:hypothetical protein